MSVVQDLLQAGESDRGAGRPFSSRWRLHQEFVERTGAGNILHSDVFAGSVGAEYEDGF